MLRKRGVHVNETLNYLKICVRLLTSDAKRGQFDRKSEEREGQKICVIKHTQNLKPQQKQFWCTKKQVVQFV